MDSAAWVLDLLTAPATPLYGMLLIVSVMAWRASVQGFPAIILALVERRRATAAEKAADWERLRDEVKRLSAENEQCHEDLAKERECRHRDVSALRDDLNAAKGRIAELEGYMMGAGKANQEAAGIVAIERINRAIDKDKGGGGE